MGQLSDETSGKIQRVVEETDPKTEVLSIILEKTDERNEEKIHINADERTAELHSGKSIELRTEDKMEVDRERDRDLYIIRGLSIDRELTREVTVDVKMEKDNPPISAEIRYDDRREEIRLEREISEKIDLLYSRAEEVARDSENLRFYSTHTHPHIESVAKISLEIGNSLGYRTEEVQREILYAAISHDLGMTGLPRDDQKPYDRTELLEDLDRVRPMHPINSAIEVIRNQDLYRSEGVNPTHIALASLLHSKSTSRTTNLDEPRQIYDAIDRLEKEIKAKGLDTEKNMKVVEDLKDFFDKEDRDRVNPSRLDELNQVKTVAIITAIGDAFSHTHGTPEKGLCQSGYFYDCRHDEKTKDIEKVDLLHYTNPGERTVEKEIEDYSIYTYEERDGERLEIASKHMGGASLDVAFFYGEANIRLDMHPSRDEDKIIVNVEIQESRVMPASTFFAIEERIKEFPRVHFYNSDNRELQIEFRIDAKDKDTLTNNERTNLSEFYEAKAESYMSLSNSEHIYIRTII